VTVPGTLTPVLVMLTVKDAVVIVAGSIGSLNVTVILAKVDTTAEPC
jgi:hypothetical protein